jgi:hypothetical protein
MVIVTDFAERKNQLGEKFHVLIIESEPEIVKSENGKLYARTMKTTIPSTFNETIGKAMIGRKLPGRIIKEECDPYEYEVNGKMVELNHTYRYSDEASIEETVFEGEEL